jgi:glycosyltransferase involved in cell wall biosynthesis
MNSSFLIPHSSFIIACRNEISNLPTLLESIENQSFKPSEVIFVDDNSTDETYNFLLNYSQKYNYIKVIKNTGKGKKSALIQAAKLSSAELLIFTDADCVLNKDYLFLANQYLSNHNTDMLLGAVDILDEKGVFNIIEKIEFASLQAVTAYSALIKNPIMCNGANLIVRRTKYLQYIAQINKNIASGDDMFMLHAFKKNSESINYLYDANYIVKTKGTNSPKKFLF